MGLSRFHFSIFYKDIIIFFFVEGCNETLRISNFNEYIYIYIYTYIYIYVCIYILCILQNEKKAFQRFLYMMVIEKQLLRL